MAKEVKVKKDKKEKKEKRADAEGVTKPKKEKKDKKVKGDVEMVDALEAELEKAPEDSLVKVVTGEDGDEPRGALVPFAFPLTDDAKELKKILKTVKKSAKTKTLRRGVKEVVKALRKSQTASADLSNPIAIVVIAADISPMDVISHIPVLCEDHSVPYIYIKSRAQLGEASATKRPTSVVMISRDRTGKKKEGKEEDDEEFTEAYAELVKLVGKASKTVRK
ncbi:50S ribosomal protein L30e-like protein [Paraphoma chrysanthemicola]|uniref:50S ribosomal protein L30e-like protein n=1 Tax=Paraphoma chrysanthemicola TaxID=798071 RepID=A0A8K0VWL2_9PLEO|nr:50S ribosomal protein L30e-like protein [Paraphoma chrysanthemicola]